MGSGSTTPLADAGSQSRRALIVFAVIASWAAAGYWFHMGGNTYLLLGVPLLLVFQWGIARRPIAELWFKQPCGAPLPWWGWLVAGLFMLPSLFLLIHGWGRFGWIYYIYLLCAAVGAVPLAYSIARFSRSTVRPLQLCFVTAGAFGTMVAARIALLKWLHSEFHPSAAVAVVHARSGLLVGVQSFLMYLPIGFIVEEVFFRGGLDSYLQRPGDRGPWWTACFLSALWGLWHLPIVPAHSILGTLVLVMVHMLIGVPFSLYWRSSGMLFVPAIVHAFIDAVRNALI